MITTGANSQGSNQDRQAVISQCMMSRVSERTVDPSVTEARQEEIRKETYSFHGDTCGHVSENTASSMGTETRTASEVEK